jgi:hypothetical protein
MMVASIENGNRGRRPPKGTGGVEPGEPGTDNHDMGQ